MESYADESTPDCISRQGWGDEEAMYYDADYIRDVILFPRMRRED